MKVTDILQCEERVNLLEKYLDMLLEVNTHTNLTAVSNRNEAWSRHILDSLQLLPFLREEGALIDIGSGGGLPGIPLAIAQPERPVCLLEATGKKARFLESVADTLSLTNVRVIPERAETAAHDSGWRGRFIYTTSRAVGSLSELLEISLPFLRINGHVLALKGKNGTHELGGASHALAELGGGTPLVTVVLQPDLTESCILSIQKERETPDKYPRRPGMPKKRPL